MDKLYRKEEVWEMLGISRATLNRIIADGELPVMRIRGQVRVSRSDLEAYLGRCKEHKPTKPAKAAPETKKEPAQTGRPKGSRRGIIEAYVPGMRVV